MHVSCFRSCNVCLCFVYFANCSNGRLYVVTVILISTIHKMLKDVTSPDYIMGSHVHFWDKQLALTWENHYILGLRLGFWLR